MIVFKVDLLDALKFGADISSYSRNNKAINCFLDVL